MVHLDIIYLVIIICKYGIPTYISIKISIYRNDCIALNLINLMLLTEFIALTGKVLDIFYILIETYTSDLYISSLGIYMLSWICKTSITKPSFDIKINIAG